MHAEFKRNPYYGKPLPAHLERSVRVSARRWGLPPPRYDRVM